MRKSIFFLLLVITSTLAAQNVDSLFVKANELYKTAQFTEAIETYKQIENKNQVSSDLYYNLGNSYYKLNKVGPAIFYYEKALQLNPDNEDVKNNLVFAKRLALDNIEPLPKTVFQKLKTNYLQALTYNQWAVVVVVFSFLGGVLFLFYYFSYSSLRKRLFFITSMISFLFLLMSLVVTYNQFSFDKNTKEAIVFAEESEVRNAPTFNSEEVFVLHEGTKVFVLDAVDDWKKIQLADGKQGWIIASEVQEF
jgi:tetratricopeptide (TPR) repeat protein